MKRFLLSFLFALCIVTCYNVFKADACVAPLAPDNAEAPKNVSAYKAENISMQYCKLDVRPNSGYFTVVAEIAVKNNAEKSDIMLGIPYYFYNGLADSRDVAVNYKGSTVKVSRLNAVKNSNLEDSQIFYNSYYCWTVSVDAGETAYMYITFNVSTRPFENGMQCIDIPLDLLSYWSDKSSSIDITVGSNATNIYSYDRAPSVQPSSVSENGSLKWTMDIAIAKNNLIVYYNVDNTVLSKFFVNMYTTGVEKDAAELFRTRQYDAVLSLIESENLSDNINFMFMKMVCLEKLGLKDSADEILKEIYDKEVCFSGNNLYDISEYVHKRMLYSYYTSLPISSQELIKSKVEVLKNGISSLSDSKSSVFKKWASSEIKLLDSSATENPQENEDDKKPTNPGTPTSNSWLKKISEPVIITVGIVMIVVVVFCLMGMFSGNKKVKKTKNRRIKR